LEGCFVSGWHAGQIQSIAVLPLANRSGDAAQDCFAEGITEELITDLAKVESLKVISRTSVLHLKGTEETCRKLHAS
jgi:TolB-like protein